MQKVLGEAEVAAVFDIGLGGRKKMKVAGSKVRNGLVNKSSKVRVFRGEEVVHDGKLLYLAFLPPTWGNMLTCLAF